MQLPWLFLKWRRKVQKDFRQIWRKLAKFSCLNQTKLFLNTKNNWRILLKGFNNSFWTIKGHIWTKLQWKQLWNFQIYHQTSSHFENKVQDYYCQWLAAWKRGRRWYRHEKQKTKDLKIMELIKYEKNIPK